MSSSDFLLVSQWWFLFLVIGIIFLPTTFFLFSSFLDKGYIFAKVLGIAVISYIIFVLGVTHILPFTRQTAIIVIALTTILNYTLLFFPGYKKALKKPFLDILKQKGIFIVVEEAIFFITLWFWAFIRGFEPSIHGLEKYMDFGFVNSILRTEYLPPKDMWLTPFSINYYYFGHLVTAVITKILDIPSNYSFNLMLAHLFAFTFTCSFSLGLTLLSFTLLKNTREGFGRFFTGVRLCIGSLFIAFLVALAGNLHTIYTLFDKYSTENPQPFWHLAFSPQTFPNSYWYPNATRFIYNTIHEFPIYSFVVSDLHGHVLDIPFVLLTLALILSMLLAKRLEYIKLGCIAFLLAVLYMSNAWDGMIYFLLSVMVIIYIHFKSKNNTDHNENIKHYISGITENKYLIPNTLYLILFIGIGAAIFSLPFSLGFSPASIVHGIGVLCAPKFLTDKGHIGPFLFEANHCQKSPLWQLFILYGFFYFWTISFIVFLFKRPQAPTFDLDHQNPKQNGFLNFGHWKLIENFKLKIENLNPVEAFILLLIILSTLLIIIPEFLYMKDIYPAHYRANTMFKLVYQSFMMLSLISGYTIIKLLSNLKAQISFANWRIKFSSFLLVILVLIGSIGLFFVSIYPYFAIKSYYRDLKIYDGLNGTAYLKSLYPTDYHAILWLNKNVSGQPVILEAQGDSYTDYARVSANTGLPTVLGWTVHEWLWRGSYDVPAPRISDVQTLYETPNSQTAKDLLQKYHVSLVFVGDLERQKYPHLFEEKFKELGTIIYQNGQTRIYRIL